MITVKTGNFISYAVLFVENRTQYTDIMESADNSDIVDHALKSCGFTLYRKRMVYLCSGDDLLQDPKL